MPSLFATLQTVRWRGVQFSEHPSGDPAHEPPEHDAGRRRGTQPAGEPVSGPWRRATQPERDQDHVGVSNGIAASRVHAATQVT